MAIGKILGGIFGGSSKETAQNTEQSTANLSRTQGMTGTTQTGSSQTGSVSSTSQTTSTQQNRQSDTEFQQRALDQQSEAAIRDVLLAMSGDTRALTGGITGGATGSLDFASGMQQRAAGIGDRLTGGNADIINAARVEGEKALTRQGTDLSQQAGSGLNSFVQQMQAEGAVDLEVQLANLAAQLGFQTVAAEETALSGAAVAGDRAVGTAGGVETSRVGGLGSLGNVLKGAVTSGTSSTAEQLNSIVNTVGRSETQSTTQQVQSGVSVQDILNATQSEVKGVGVAESSDSPGLLDVLKVVGSFA